MSYKTLDKLFRFFCQTFKNDKKQSISSFKLQNYVREVQKYCGTDWKEHVSFSNNKYKRINLKRCPENDFEFVLICWKKGQQSPIHDHANNGCIMHVLSGSVEEILFQKTPYTDHIYPAYGITRKAGDTGYISNDIGYHKIIADEDTVSLHVYSPSGYDAKCYDILN